MPYQTTITQKGQVTIPKKIRDFLGLKPFSKVIWEIEKKEVKVKSMPDVLDLAGKFKPKRKIPILKTREKLERKYEER